MNLYYFIRRWLAVYGYLLLVLIAAPWLPLVLGVEVSTGVLLIISAGGMFFFNARKFPCYALIIGGFIAFAWVFYVVIPNPYELSHLPEYVILGALVLHALKGAVEESEKVTERPLYFRSAVITGVVGTIDELYQVLLPLRYFAWYDVVLNGFGGLLGLTLFWGISKE